MEVLLFVGLDVHDGVFLRLKTTIQSHMICR